VNHPLHAHVRTYYEQRLRAYGATPAGVDWNSRESQELRFAQLARLWGPEREASLLDFGCGYGALLPWVRERGFTGRYAGFDLSGDMIAEGSRAAAAAPRRDWTFTADRQDLTPADFVVASGIFNVKMDTPAGDWHDYVLATIDELAALAVRGFAFNALTAYSDPDKQRSDLYYADPLELFDYCTRTHSRSVALLHDYPLYEFTMLVRRR